MYRSFIAPHFKRQLKPYTKKHRSISKDIAELLENFDKRQCVDLGRGLYKARLKSRDIPRGKSKSFRIIIFFIEAEDILAPIVIYCKSDQKNISKKELNDHLQTVIFEIGMQGL